MAKAKEVKRAKRGRPDAPFGMPADDEEFEVIIPEGADTGQIPEGEDYIGKCTSVIKEKSKKSDNPMFTWTFTIIEGDYRGMDFNLWTVLTVDGIFKLAQTLNALGIPYKPGKKLIFTPGDVKNILVRMSIKDDVFEGMPRSKLAAVLPHPDGTGIVDDSKIGFVLPKKVDEDDEEEERPRRRGRPAKDEDEEPEEEAPRRRRPARDEVEEEEEVAPRRRARREEPEPEEEEEVVPRRRARSAKEEDDWEEPPASPPRKKRVVEEEDEEEEMPRRRARVVEEEEEETRATRKPARRSRL